MGDSAMGGPINAGASRYARRCPSLYLRSISDLASISFVLQRPFQALLSKNTQFWLYYTCPPTRVVLPALTVFTVNEYSEDLLA